MEIYSAHCALTVASYNTAIPSLLIQQVPLTRHSRRLMQGVGLLGCYAMLVVGLAAATCKAAYRYFLLHSLGNSFVGWGWICSRKG